MGRICSRPSSTVRRWLGPVQARGDKITVALGGGNARRASQTTTNKSHLRTSGPHVEHTRYVIIEWERVVAITHFSVMDIQVNRSKRRWHVEGCLQCGSQWSIIPLSAPVYRSTPTATRELNRTFVSFNAFDTICVHIRSYTGQCIDEDPGNCYCCFNPPTVG